MSSLLIAVMMSTLCNIWGPGLGLRGPTGSMGKAVAGLKIELGWTINFFEVGVFCFHISGITYSWIAFDSHLTVR